MYCSVLKLLFFLVFVILIDFDTDRILGVTLLAYQMAAQLIWHFNGLQFSFREW